ncbi:class I SAM-dependent methyltransferase [Desertibaculum subflavum]|uniref:class I SAM-dependent methyltransferase n=1 Tax=Desertibaculum subflavum TaxID=2268458 RepID=UPI000E668F88
MALVDRLAYGANRAARVGWYTAHYFLARRIAPADGERRATREEGLALRAELRRAMADLFAAELADIESGIYRAPPPFELPPHELVARSLRFFADIREVDARRRGRVNDEPFRAGLRPDLPRYYLQNFHYQTDGWLSPQSAALYDTQVETLFTGMADAMRRRALPPLRRALAGRLRSAKLLDIACGTGRFLAEVKRNWPRLAVTGLDLSGDYLAEARRLLAPWSRVDLVEANAEAMPLPDAAFDAVTAIFLFHELPRAVRVRVAAEIARVLKPGGTFVLVDSLQKGDRPAFDGLIEAFPRSFHEPYYADYARTDLAALFGEAGLRLRETELAFMSKVTSWQREP